MLIDRLNFSNGCLSSIFYVAAAVLVAQDPHVGSKMNAAAFVIGPLWFGTILAGCMVCVHTVTAAAQLPSITHIVMHLCCSGMKCISVCKCARPPMRGTLFQVCCHLQYSDGPLCMLRTSRCTCMHTNKKAVEGNTDTDAAAPYDCISCFCFLC